MCSHTHLGVRGVKIVRAEVKFNYLRFFNGVLKCMKPQSRNYDTYTVSSPASLTRTQGLLN